LRTEARQERYAIDNRKTLYRFFVYDECRKVLGAGEQEYIDDIIASKISSILFDEHRTKGNTDYTLTGTNAQIKAQIDAEMRAIFQLLNIPGAEDTIPQYGNILQYDSWINDIKEMGLNANITSTQSQSQSISTDITK
jgi:hypothetical protein